MRVIEAQIRPVLEKKGITPADLQAAGAHFVDGWYECEDAAHKAMMRAASARRPFGLGDAVASVAQPIARALDGVLGTQIQGCGGCAQRQAALNRIIPDLKL